MPEVILNAPAYKTNDETSLDGELEADLPFEHLRYSHDHYIERDSLHAFLTSRVHLLPEVLTIKHTPGAYVAASIDTDFGPRGQLLLSQELLADLETFDRSRGAPRDVLSESPDNKALRYLHPRPSRSSTHTSPHDQHFPTSTFFDVHPA